jgi:CrcB protein
LGTEAGENRNKLARLLTSNLVLILVGGALGSYLRYWLPTRTALVSLGPLVGGALGSYLRYRLGRWCNLQRWGQEFPFGTLFINVSGSFILAAAAVSLVEGLGHDYLEWYLWIGPGFCGGFTTFSTFEWETYRLVRDGSRWLALANVLGSVAAGFLAVGLAVTLAGLVLPSEPLSQSFPFDTLIINVSGSLILAVAAVIFLERLPPAHQDWYLLIGTGFCGGYTTFSAFEWETFKLVRDGNWTLAITYVVGSVVAGFFAVLLGVRLAGFVFMRLGRK